MHLAHPVFQAVHQKSRRDGKIAIYGVSAPGVVAVDPEIRGVQVVKASVEQPFEIDRGPVRAPFRRMIQGDIENHSDACPVQSFHHVPEFARVSALVRRHAIAGMGRKEAVSAVAPVVFESPRRRRFRHVLRVESHHGHELDVRNAELPEIGDLFDHAGKGSGVPNAGRRVPRESPHVHFINDRLLRGPADRPVPFPIIGVVPDSDAPHGGGRVISGQARAAAVPQTVADGAGARI